MEIEQQLQSGIRTALGNFDRTGQVADTAAVVGMRSGLIRVIPDADTDRIDTRIRKRQKNVTLVSVPVAEFHAAFFQRNDRRNISTLERITVLKRQTGHTGIHDGFCRAG